MAAAAAGVWALLLSPGTKAGAGMGDDAATLFAASPAPDLVSVAAEDDVGGLGWFALVVAAAAVALIRGRLSRPAPAAMARGDLPSSSSGPGGAAAAGVDELAAGGVFVCTVAGVVLLLTLAEAPSGAAAVTDGVTSAGATGELPGFFGAGVPAAVALLSSAGVRMRVAVTSVPEASIASAPSCTGGGAAVAAPVAGLVWAGGTAATGVAVALPAVAAGVLGGETAGYEVVGTEAATSGLPALLPAIVAAAVFVAAAGVAPPL